MINEQERREARVQLIILRGILGEMDNADRDNVINAARTIRNVIHGAETRTAATAMGLVMSEMISETSREDIVRWDPEAFRGPVTPVQTDPVRTISIPESESVGIADDTMGRIDPNPYGHENDADLNGGV